MARLRYRFFANLFMLASRRRRWRRRRTGHHCRSIRTSSATTRELPHSMPRHYSWPRTVQADESCRSHDHHRGSPPIRCAPSPRPRCRTSRRSRPRSGWKSCSWVTPMLAKWVFFSGVASLENAVTTERWLIPSFGVRRGVFISVSVGLNLFADHHGEKTV